jgi:hypothetical protein
MAKTRPPYSPEFRRQMVELVRVDTAERLLGALTDAVGAAVGGAVEPLGRCAPHRGGRGAAQNCVRYQRPRLNGQPEAAGTHPDALYSAASAT